MNRFLRHGRKPLLAAAAVIAAVCLSDGAEPAGSGMLTDQRNDRVYKTTKVGAKTWMADNINFETGVSWCYDGDSTNCNAYGRLYDWTTAKTVCPSGWRLPTVKEWGVFVKAVNDREVAEKKAMAKKRSDEDDYTANEFRFPAILGGGRYRIGGEFRDIGGYSYWWAGTESANRYAYYSYVNYGYVDTVANFDGKEYGLSVRCLKD
jgi:uncharacterized protein (TIGR02145 family)